MKGLKAGVSYMAANSWLCHFYTAINTYCTHIYTHIHSYVFVFDGELKRECVSCATCGV